MNVAVMRCARVFLYQTFVRNCGVDRKMQRTFVKQRKDLLWKALPVATEK